MSARYNLLRSEYVRAAAWPASTTPTPFKTFFTLVLLQQILASTRQGQALDAAVPVLVPLLQHPEEAVRDAAAEAVGKTGTLAAEALGPMARPGAGAA